MSILQACITNAINSIDHTSGGIKIVRKCISAIEIYTEEDILIGIAHSVSIRTKDIYEKAGYLITQNMAINILNKELWTKCELALVA
jgi:hypothetical protein